MQAFKWQIQWGFREAASVQAGPADRDLRQYMVACCVVCACAQAVP